MVRALFAIAAIPGLVAIAIAGVAWAQEHRAIFTLVVNLQKQQEVTVLLRPKDVLIRASDLEAGGVTGFHGTREVVFGEKYVSLASLAPDISYSVDLKTLSLKLTTRPSHLGATAIDLSRVHPPPGLIHTNNLSAFFNYSVTVANQSSVSMNNEIGISMFGNSLADTTMFFDGARYIRGMTNLTIDDPEHLNRLILGDSLAISANDPLGGASYFAGLSFARDFAINPYFVRTPQGNLSGVAMFPSTADIYENGRLVKTVTIPPGPFSLQNLPMINGAGSADVVVRNGFGYSQSVSAPYYLNVQTLGAGLSDYTLDFGLTRNNYGTSSWQYSHGLADGQWRHGVNDWFTTGFRFEAENERMSGGPLEDFATPIGGFEASAAGSYAPGAVGWAGFLGYQYLRQESSFSITGLLEVLSPHYSNLSYSPVENRPLVLGNFSVSKQLTRRLALIPAFQWSQSRDTGHTYTGSLTSEIAIARGLYLSIVASRSGGSVNGTSSAITASLSIDLGDSRLATLTAGDQQGGLVPHGDLESVQLQKSLPYGTGYGYLLQAGQGQASNALSAQIMDRGDHGYYEFDYGRQNGVTTTDATISGSIVSVGGRALAGPPVQDAFALIRTDSVGSVEGYDYGNVIGRTDAKGDLLVPNLLSYYGNKLSIEQHDVPINYEIDSNEFTIAPPYRGGALVNFPIRLIRAFTGKMLVVRHGKEIVPKFGLLTLTAGNKEFTSPIGNKGDFYLDSPPSGAHLTKVDFEKGECQIKITIPAGKESFVKLGTLRCTMQ